MFKNAAGQNITFGSSYFKRQLTGAQLASGDAVLNALMGGSGKTFRKSIEIDQQLALAQDTMLIADEFPDTWAFAEVNKTRLEGVPWELTPKYVSTMGLGTRANFFAEMQDRDIVKVAETVWKLLNKYSPVKTGFLKMRHEIYIDERIHRIGQSTKTEMNSFAIITNRVEYASTLESQAFKQKTKAYARTFTAVKRKYGKDWSVLYLFLDPTRLGGHLRKPSRSSATQVYAIPAIIIAPLNVLPYGPTVRATKRRTVWGSEKAGRRLQSIKAQAIRRRGKMRIR